jgi:uncharacterized protein
VEACWEGQMITPDLLKTIIADQLEEGIPEQYVERVAQEKLSALALNKEIIVLTGIRRSGKSVLLQQLRKQYKQSNYYLNFEDERLINFNVEDFQLLQEIFIELYGIEKTFFFDEIQNVEKWELFVRRLYNGGNKIFITGSNASLFSDELGTRLTGRYISLSIYPYSFYEFAQEGIAEFANKPAWSTTQLGKVRQLFSAYCMQGGFPEYVKHRQDDYLRSLYESILYRDIIARYRISNVKVLKELVFYLASNCSKEMTFSSLQKLLGLGSATTVSDYCSHLENSYLCFFVNRYSESVKAQMQSPKKVYFIDHVLAKIVGFRFSDDVGRLLENIVYIELRRRNYEVFYHKENKECDFIARKNGKMLSVLQVCQHLANAKTKQREIDGLLEALDRYSLEEGYILTENEEETMNVRHDQRQYKIIILPLWKWLLIRPD